MGAIESILPVQDGDGRGAVESREEPSRAMIAAPLETAEREPAAGTDGRSVPVDDPALELLQAPLECRAACGVDARRQPVIRRVGDRDRLLRARGVVDGEVGTEQLLPLVRRARP